MEKTRGRHGRKSWKFRNRPTYHQSRRMPDVQSGDKPQLVESVAPSRIDVAETLNHFQDVHVDIQPSYQVKTVTNAHNDYNGDDTASALDSSNHLTCKCNRPTETAALYLKFPGFLREPELKAHLVKHGFACNIVAIDMHFNKHTKYPAGSAKVLLTPPSLVDHFISSLHGTCLPGEYQQLLSVQPYVVQSRHQLTKEKLKPCKVFIGSGLPSTICEKDIREHFVEYAHVITNVEVIRESKRDTCYVVVTFETKISATKAIENYHNSYFYGKRIKVEVYKPKYQPPSPAADPVTVSRPKIYSKAMKGHKTNQSDYHLINKPDHVKKNAALESLNPTSSKTSNDIKLSKSTDSTKGIPLNFEAVKLANENPNGSTTIINLAGEPLSLECTFRHQTCKKYSAEDEVQHLSNTTTVNVENLDPNVSQNELEHLTGVKIDRYVPSNLTPEKTAAWIEVANHEDALTIASNLNERNVLGTNIHCCAIESSALHKCRQSYHSDYSKPNTDNVHPTEDYHPLPFMSNEASNMLQHSSVGVQQQSTIPFILPNGAMVPLLPATETKRLQIKQGQWDVLTAKQQDGTMLLDKLVSPFKINPNGILVIQLQWDTSSIGISGVSDAVNFAYNHISYQLNRHLYVEDRIKMSALVYLNPSLPQDMIQKHGVVISGYYKTSFMLIFDGFTSTAVRAARDEVDSLLDKAIVDRLRPVFSHSLLPLAQKQLEVYGYMAYISTLEHNMATLDNSPQNMHNSMNVTLCSFDQLHHEKAVTFFLNTVPTKQEISVPFDFVFNSFINQQVKQLKEDCCVVINSEDKEIHHRIMVVAGFCPINVMNAYRHLSSLISRFSEERKKLDCTSEQVIYLYKVDKEGIAVLLSLHVQVNIQNDEIELRGSPESIAKSEDKIFRGPLLGLQFKRFSFGCNIIFASQIEHDILKPATIKHKFNLQYFISNPEGDNQYAEQTAKVDGFEIIVYSKDNLVFNTMCKEMELIMPHTEQFFLHCQEAVAYVRQVKEKMEGKYHVRVNIHQDTDDNIPIMLYGLIPKETQQCWNDIETDIKSEIVITSTVSLTRHECIYLDKKCSDKLREEFECCCIEFQWQSESEMFYSVRVRGKIKDVEAFESRLSNLLKLKIEINSFSIECRQSHLRMWRKWWTDLANKEQEKHDVIIKMYENKVAKNDESIQVNFEVIGTDIYLLKCIERIICNDDTEEKIIKESEASKLLQALKHVEEFILLKNLAVACESNQVSDAIVLVSPKSLSIDLVIAEAEVKSFLKDHAIVSKELICHDQIVGLILTSTTMSVEYVKTARSIAKPHSVELEVLNNTDYIAIKLTGSSKAILLVEPLIHEHVLKQIEKSVSTIQYTASASLKTVLEASEFLHVESKLQDEQCVKLSYPVPYSKVICSVKIEPDSKQFHHGVQVSICYGNILHEDIDAIVNSTNEDLNHTSGLAKMISKYGGSTIQEESNKYIESNGKLSTGSCVCLGAGKLPCRKIIHAVGPQWHGGKANEKQHLYETVHGCLQCADKEKLSCIALPAISTDLFSMPEDICAEASLNAVYDYCKSILISSIKTVKFIVHTPSMLKHFYSAFKIIENMVEDKENSRPLIFWYWMNDEGSYSLYSSEESEKLTDMFEHNPKGSYTCVINEQKYCIYFPTMTQTNCMSGRQRQVKRTEHHSESSSTPKVTQHDVAYYWMYRSRDDVKLWSRYQIQHHKIIEEFYQSGYRMLKLTINGQKYIINFNRMCQFNVSTKNECKIQRVDITSSTCAASREILRYSDGQDYEVSENHFTIFLHGPLQNLHQAKAELHEKLQSLHKSASLRIPYSLKDKSFQIADMYNVTCSLDGDQTLEMKRKLKLFVTLKGSVTNVNHVLASIKEEVEFYRSDFEVHFNALCPEEWEEHSEGQTLRLVQLDSESEEWDHVEKKVTHTMPFAVICKITRIQNKWLWSKYAFERQRMMKKNNGVINELELFHGTRRNSPQNIHASETGFDMRYSKIGGNWGQANYFAEQASYTNNYAHVTSDKKKEIFLVKVLTGHSYIMTEFDRSLRKPPRKSRLSSEDDLQPLHYDTVSGYVGTIANTICSKVYMTYDNDKAYPAYLIQYL